MPRTSVVNANAVDRVETAAARLYAAKMLLEETQRDFEAAEIDYLEAIGIAEKHNAFPAVKRVKFTTPGGAVMICTYTQGKRTVVDDAKLATSLGARLWNKVTVRKLDNKLLKSAIERGEISATTVAGCSEILDNKPFAKFSPQNKPAGLTAKVARAKKPAKAPTVLATKKLVVI